MVTNRLQVQSGVDGRIYCQTMCVIRDFTVILELKELISMFGIHSAASMQPHIWLPKEELSKTVSLFTWFRIANNHSCLLFVIIYHTYLLYYYYLIFYRVYYLLLIFLVFLIALERIGL